MTTTAPRQKRKRARPTFGDAATDTRRIAIYVRRSTDDEHQPFSIDAQITALKSYVNSQPGWVLVNEPYDDDASGATTDRPGLQRALRAARAGRFDVFLVYRVDRFSRRLSDLLDLLTELDEAGVAFASATEPFDTSTAIGRMLVQLLGVFAEFERETIIDRTINGMSAKARKGKWPTGARPYGYTVDKETSKLTISEDEAPVVREVFRLYTQSRLGTRAIATELNRRGIPNRIGKQWSGLVVSRVLENPAYLGAIAFRDVYVEEAHKPIIDNATWNRARRIANARTDAQTHRAMSDSEYHLTGLITCPECGKKYIGTSAKGRGLLYHYYTCYSRVRYGSSGCGAPRLKARATDAATLQALYDFFSQAEPLITMAANRARQNHREAHADRRAELVTIERQITTKTAAIDRYLAAFEAGTMSDAVCGPRLTSLREEIAQLEGRRDEIADAIDTAPSAPPADLLKHLSDYLAEVIASGTPAARKAIIEALVAEISIHEGKVIPVFKIPVAGATSVDSEPRAVTGPRFAQCSGKLPRLDSNQ
ncbi:MAG: recombinase family protein [Micromonosporaceae bacterium]